MNGARQVPGPVPLHWLKRLQTEPSRKEVETGNGPRSKIRGDCERPTEGRAFTRRIWDGQTLCAPPMVRRVDLPVVAAI
jgi:hypothetical protein